MSTGTPMVARALTATGLAFAQVAATPIPSVPNREAVEISVGLPSGEVGDGNAVWRQVNEILRASLEKRGVDKPGRADVLERHTREGRRGWRTVAPGIIVPADEYEERYAGVDLEWCRENMTPEVFRTFVRFVGSLRGQPELDIAEVTSMPED